MEFSDKLNFLINLTQTSNKELARELLEHCLQETKSPDWQFYYQMYLDNLEAFETSLEKDAFIDIAELASAEEVRAGRVTITPLRPSVLYAGNLHSVTIVTLHSPGLKH